MRIFIGSGERGGYHVGREVGEEIYIVSTERYRLYLMKEEDIYRI